MSTAVLETPLEEDLGDIGCEGNVRQGGKLVRCTQAAVSRVLFTCDCGHSPRFFICAGHLDSLRAGHYWCPVCGKTRGSFAEC